MKTLIAGVSQIFNSPFGYWLGYIGCLTILGFILEGIALWMYYKHKETVPYIYHFFMLFLYISGVYSQLYAPIQLLLSQFYPLKNILLLNSLITLPIAVLVGGNLFQYLLLIDTQRIIVQNNYRFSQRFEKIKNTIF